MVWMLLYLPRESVILYCISCLDVCYCLIRCLSTAMPTHSTLQCRIPQKKFTFDITNEIPKVVKGNPKREAWLLLKKYKDFSTLGDYIDTLITRNIMF